MGEVCASVPSLPTQGHAEFDIWEWDSLQPRKAFGNFVGYNTSGLKDGGKKSWTKPTTSGALSKLLSMAEATVDEIANFMQPNIPELIRDEIRWLLSTY